MKIICKYPKLLQVFDSLVLKPFRVLKFDYSKYFDGFKIYIGENPGNVEYSHINPETKEIVIACNNYFKLGNIFKNKEILLFTDMKEGMHELWHGVHFKELATLPDWYEWSQKTGHELDLNYSQISQVPSYETFAREGAKLIEYLIPQYYLDLLGIEKTPDYKALENLEILKRAGYLKPALYYRTRKNILDKY